MESRNDRVLKELHSVERRPASRLWFTGLGVFGMIVFGSWVISLVIGFISFPGLFDYLEPVYFIPAPIGLALSVPGYLASIQDSAQAKRKRSRLRTQLVNLSDEDLHSIACRCEPLAQAAIGRCLHPEPNFMMQSRATHLRPGQRQVLIALSLCSDYETGYIRAGEVLPAVLETETRFLPPDEKFPVWIPMAVLTAPALVGLFFAETNPMISISLIAIGMFALAFLGLYWEHAKGFQLPLPYDAETLADLAILGKRYAVSSLGIKKDESPSLKRYAKYRYDSSALWMIRDAELRKRFGLPEADHRAKVSTIARITERKNKS